MAQVDNIQRYVPMKIGAPINWEPGVRLPSYLQVNPNGSVNTNPLFILGDVPQQWIYTTDNLLVRINPAPIMYITTGFGTTQLKKNAAPVTIRTVGNKVYISVTGSGTYLHIDENNFSIQQYPDSRFASDPSITSVEYTGGAVSPDILGPSISPGVSIQHNKFFRLEFVIPGSIMSNAVTSALSISNSALSINTSGKETISDIWIYTSDDLLQNPAGFYIGPNFSIVKDATQAVKMDVKFVNKNSTQSNVIYVAERSTGNYLARNIVPGKNCPSASELFLPCMVVKIMTPNDFPVGLDVPPLDNVLSSFTIAYRDKIPYHLNPKLPSGIYHIYSGSDCLKSDGNWVSCPATLDDVTSYWTVKDDELSAWRTPGKKSRVAWLQTDTTPTDDLSQIPNARIAPIYCDGTDADKINGRSCNQDLQNDNLAHQIYTSVDEIYDTKMNICYDKDRKPYYCNLQRPFNIVRVNQEYERNRDELYSLSDGSPTSIVGAKCKLPVNNSASNPINSNYEDCCAGKLKYEDTQTVTLNPMDLSDSGTPDDMSFACGLSTGDEIEAMIATQGHLGCSLEFSNAKQGCGIRPTAGRPRRPYPNFVLTTPIHACDRDVTGHHTPSPAVLDTSKCDKNWCPFSSECKDSKAMRDYCSQLDNMGHPNLNTDVNCKNWYNNNPGNGHLAADEFCKKYHDHPACGCIYFTQSNDWKNLQELFKISSTQSFVPDPTCWASVCTVRDISDPDKTLFNQDVLEAKGAGCDVQLSICKQEIDISNVQGDVNVLNNTFSQFCGGAEFCDYDKGKWSDCADGKKNRINTLKPSINNTACAKTKTETADCNCNYSAWSDWSPCVDGNQHQTQDVVPGSDPGCLPQHVKTQTCHINIPCSYGDFGPFSECINGSQSRKANLINGDNCEPVKTETHTCQPEDHTCVYTEYGEWEPCNSGKTVKRIKTLVSGGTECSKTVEETKDCPQSEWYKNWKIMFPVGFGVVSMLVLLIYLLKNRNNAPKTS